VGNLKIGFLKPPWEKFRQCNQRTFSRAGVPFTTLPCGSSALRLEQRSALCIRMGKDRRRLCPKGTEVRERRGGGEGAAVASHHDAAAALAGALAPRGTLW